MKDHKKVRMGYMISNRVNLLFATTVLLFTILVVRLAQMQLVEKSFYQEKLGSENRYTVKSSMPRGRIFDAKGKLLVDNHIKEVVSFTRNNLVTAEEIKSLAWKLSEFVKFTETKVTDREKRDYYLAEQKNYEQVVEMMPDEKKYDKFGNHLEEAVIYANAVAAVSEKAIDYAEDELKVVYIFSQMNGTPTFGTSSLTTENLSPEQIARIITSKELSGISIRSDWDRKEVKSPLSSIIGKVSTEKTGLPQEDVEEYLAKGYALNDRVGTSFLEKSYEEFLQGQPKIKEVTVDRTGEIVSDLETQEGEQGNNLKLTVDLEFQKGVEDILTNHFNSEKTKGNVDHSEGVYAVALNPNTGAVLSLAGLSHDTETGKLENDALGAITKSFTPGSVVKGATIAAAYQNGILQGNQVLNDQPIQLAGSNPITSWFNSSGVIPMTAQQALEYSSNSYMVQIAIRLMGQQYQSGMILSNTGTKDAMTKLRDVYAQFGMGVLTGLDIEGESSGFIPEDYDVSGVLTESFGQYDTYTALQLAQYVSTIANGGKRIAPHLVEGIYDTDAKGQLGNLVRAIEPKVLNTIPISEDDMGIIQQGFYDVVNNYSSYTTGRTMAQGASVTIAAKTGTAESFVKNKDGQTVNTTNMNVVAYAPANNPQIAVAVMLPHETDFLTRTSQHITRDIINLYNSMYPMY